MSDIFISYKHAQRREARQLASALAARGWTVWWDWNIPTRQDWQAELDAQLDAAGCVVVLWSADSVQSEWVLYEARHAQRTGKLIQALLEPLQPPAEFSSFQGVDLAGWEFGVPFHAGFDRLRAAIRELLDRRAPLAASRSGTLVRIPGEAGDVLRRDATTAAKPLARPAPVMLPPPPFRDLLDRRDECAAIIGALAERRNVALAGETGSGKSALLSHVGNLDHTARFHDGVVYLQAATQGENDLAQAVHEAFYDVPPGVRPSAVEMRRNLADKCALLLLDDIALAPAALGTISAYSPDSAWVFASEEMLASAQRRPVALGGLPAGDGMALFERTLSRPLSAAERTMVARIVESVQGHPARIEQAAGTAAVRGVAAALTELAKTPNLDAEDQQSRRVLAALACGGNVPLEAEQCAAIAVVGGVQDVLAKLVQRGLVQHVAPGFRLVAGIVPLVEATPEFAACRDRATAVFTQFAFEARATPRCVARLAAPMMANMAWAAQNGRSEEALRLARAIDGPLAEANRWDAWRDMLTRAHDIAIGAGDTSTAGWALHQQGTRAVLLDDKQEARRYLREARSTRKRIGDATGLKATGNNLKLLGWTRWMVLLAALAGLGVTTLGAIPLVNYVLRPIVAIGPASHDFGAQDLRAAAQPQAIQIENTGLGAVDVLDVTSQGPDANAFAVGSSCDGIRIPPKLACRLLVQFRPEEVGPRSATVVIRVRDIKDPYTVPVRGLGMATPIARLSAQAVDFGAVEIGGAAGSRRVTLHNAGSAPLIATALAIEGDGDFRIVGEDCKAAAIAAEAQCAVDLRFSPREAGSRRATLMISDNASGSPRAVALTGTGHATAKLEVAPGALEFGQQEIGTQSAMRPVRLRNAGNAPVEIQQVTLEGSSAFRVQGNCANVRLVPGAACVLELRFAPSAIEASSGRLIIANSAGGVRGVDLTGNGIGRPAIDVTPAQVDFGILKRGAGVKPRRVTIANAGTDVLLLRSPRIEGDGRFSVVNGCPERLASKAQCFVDIGFDASGAGNAGARLVVAHSAAGGPAIVALSAAIEVMLPPVIERFDSDSQVLERPRNIQLCFRARNAQQLTIEPGGTQPQSNSVGCVTRFIRDTTTFTLIARGEGGPPQQANWTVTVVGAPPPPPPPPPAQAPVIVDFRANPPLLRRPGETRLCFAAQNAERAMIEPGGPQPSSPNEGCVSRSLSETTTFTLTVSGRGTPAQQRATTVTVASSPPPPPPPQPPVIVDFRANPPLLKRPGQTRLCFAAQNAERAVIEPGGQQPSSSNEGCVSRSLSETTTFTLTVSRRDAPAQQRATTVQVASSPPPPPPPQPPVIVDFRANPPLLKRPGETRLCFAARNAERAVIEPGGPQPSSSNEGCVSRSLSTTTTFTLTVSRKGAPSQQRATTVTVVTTPDSTDVPGAGTPRNGPAKGSGVITKDVGVLKKPGALGAVELVGGWCCRSDGVIRTRKSECTGAGQQWFGTEAEANKACTFRAPR